MAGPHQPEIPGRLRLPKVRHDGDLKPSPDGHSAPPAHSVFAGEEVCLDVGLTAARAGLAALIRDGLLGSASIQAYSDGITGLGRSGQPGSASGLPGLVGVQLQDLEAYRDTALLALRWEVTGPGGEPFPVLDADLMLTPAGKHSTMLTLAGAYRRPPGTAGAGLDRAVLHQVAAATIRALLHRVAEAIAHPARAAESAATADPDVSLRASGPKAS